MKEFMVMGQRMDSLEWIVLHDGIGFRSDAQTEWRWEQAHGVKSRGYKRIIVAEVVYDEKSEVSK